MKIILVLLFLLTGEWLSPKEATVLKGLNNPTSFVIGRRYLYVAEDTKISVYSRENHHLLSQFGKTGEGPGEFIDLSGMALGEDLLVISSSGKVSLFSETGNFIREFKSPPGDHDHFIPLKNGFIGLERIARGNTFYLTANIYDSGLKKLKEIYRIEDFRQSSPFRILFPSRELLYRRVNNKILLAGKPGFAVDIMDQKGTLLYSIRYQEFRRRKFTSADERVFRMLLKKKFKVRYEIYKQYISFRDYYPEILDLFTDGNLIYALTWRNEGEKVEIFVYPFEPEASRRDRIIDLVPEVHRVKIAWQNALKPYPMVIKNQKVYQLIENPDEEWELRVFNLNR